MFLSTIQENRHQFGITAACGAGFLLFGYDQGVFGGLLDNDPFLRTFGYPDATIQGQIVATYDIGCIIGTLVSMFAGDKLGRRKCIDKTIPKPSSTQAEVFACAGKVRPVFNYWCLR